MKRRLPSNKLEHNMVVALDNLALYEALMPAIKAIVASGGGADAILKKSEVLATCKIIESTQSDKPDVALKAAIEIMNRTAGKPVERTINLYSDISKLNERDLDSQILRAIETSGAQALVEQAVAAPKATKVKQSRKPRNSDPLGQIDPSKQA